MNKQHTVSNCIEVEIRLSREQFLQYYRGTAKQIIARDSQGRVVQFPATVLQQFVDHNGVQGRFRICFTAEHRLASVTRC